jgi:iron complex outermembrane recepter protein
MHKIVFILFLLSCGTIWSQNTISGIIVNDENLPLYRSHVHIGVKSTNTATSGKYEIKNVPNGKAKIFVSFVGYQSIDTLVVIQSDASFNFKLKKKIEQLCEIEVKQNQNSFNKTVLEQKVKTDVIERNSSFSLGDALKSVAGVSLLKTGTTIVKPIINGLHSSRVPIINNNVRLEDQQWGTEHSPNFDINAAGKITVIKGASGLQYGGDAIGGLVIIEPLQTKKDSLFGKSILSVNSNGRGVHYTTSLHKGNFRHWVWDLNGSLKYMGDRQSPNYVLSNSGNSEFSFSGNLKYIGKKYDVAAYYSFYDTTIGILSASHIGNVTDLYNAIQNQKPFVVKDFTYTIKNPKQEVQHHLGKINYNLLFDNEAVLSFQYAFQYNKRFEFDVRRNSQNNKPSLDLTLNTHSVLIDYKKDNHDWIIKAGTSGLYQNNFANNDTGIRPLIPSYDKYDAGIYTIVNYILSEKMNLEGGLRYDFSHIDASKFYLKSRWNQKNYSPSFDDFIVEENGNQWLTNPNYTYHNVSSSLGLHATLINDLDWYFNVSHAVRNPNPSELFSDGLHHSTGMIELGDLRLQQEKATKIATTIQKKWSHFLVQVNPYVSSISNFMFLKPVGFETTIRGAFPVWEYQQTNALLAGVDVQTHWDITSRAKHSFSLAYVHGKNRTSNEYLIDMPPLTINNSIKFVKKEWMDLNLELKSEWVFRQNKYPNYNFTTEIIENGDLKPVEVNISMPPNSYHLMHFYSDIKFKTFKNSFVTVTFTVQNIFNTTYRDYINRQRFFVDELGRNFQIQLKLNY